MTVATAIDWFWFLSKYSLLAIPPAAVIGWILNQITAHSLFLYAQRTSSVDDPVLSYRFAIQNNEDVPLVGEHTLRIHILDPEGRFASGPEVYKGLSTVKLEMDKERRSWLMTFTELPAYDTWTIDCRMTAFARNVLVEVPESATTLSGNRLDLTAKQDSILTGRTTTEWWWCGLSILLGLVTYIGIIAPALTGLHPQDAWFIGGIVAFALGLYCCGRVFSPRIAPPVTQGYWDTTRTPFE